jgi:hypothetical protein
MTGDRFLVSHLTFSLSVRFNLKAETMAEHRAKSLSALLPTALATGFSEIVPDFEYLKVLQLINLNHVETLDI